MKNPLFTPLLLIILAFICSSVPAAKSDLSRSGSGYKTFLPGIYRGRIPCADCMGIIFTIRLKSDSSYLSESRYLGADNGKDSFYYETGRWKTDKGRLILFSEGRKQGQYLIAGKNSLKLLDSEGNEIKTKYNRLKRVKISFNPVRPFILTGMYSYFADAPVFIDCNTGIRYPVAPMPANKEVQSRYLSIRQADNQKILLRVKGFLSVLRGMDGRKQEMLSITEFIGFEQGKPCNGSR